MRVTKVSIIKTIENLPRCYQVKFDDSIDNLSFWTREEVISWFRSLNENEKVFEVTVIRL